MKCQRCQKREASILIKQSMNGKEKEYALCQDCMAELGLVNSFGLDLDNYLGAGFVSPQKPACNPSNMSAQYNSGVFVPGIKEPQVCRHCGTTLDEIRKKGRLGCNNCYETFEDQLGQVFRRIQSGDTHRGRKMAESKEKGEWNKLKAANEELQSKIKDAVDKEDYESAAKWKTQLLKNRESMVELEKTRQGRGIAEDTAAPKKPVRRSNPAHPADKSKETKKKSDQGEETEKKSDQGKGVDAK